MGQTPLGNRRESRLGLSQVWFPSTDVSRDVTPQAPSEPRRAGLLYAILVLDWVAALATVFWPPAMWPAIGLLVCAIVMNFDRESRLPGALLPFLTPEGKRAALHVVWPVADEDGLGPEIVLGNRWYTLRRPLEKVSVASLELVVRKRGVLLLSRRPETPFQHFCGSTPESAPLYVSWWRQRQAAAIAGRLQRAIERQRPPERNIERAREIRRQANAQVETYRADARRHRWVAGLVLLDWVLIVGGGVQPGLLLPAFVLLITLLFMMVTGSIRRRASRIEAVRVDRLRADERVRLNLGNDPADNGHGGLTFADEALPSTDGALALARDEGALALASAE